MYEKLTNRFVGNIGTKEFKTVYTTSTSRVKSQNSHKLIALWEEQRKQEPREYILEDIQLL